jgi:hypothetical protein
LQRGDGSRLVTVSQPSALRCGYCGGMAQITVIRQADGSFRVQTPAGTSHEVSVPAGFPARLGCGPVTPEELVRASFEFLLEREPASSILRTFSLDVIGQYFPDYPAQIRARLDSSDPDTAR